MRRTFVKPLLTLAFLAPVGLALAADAPPAKIDATQKQKTTVTDARQRQVQALMRRYEQVGLTEQQKNQIRPLVKGQMDELRALRMNREISEDDRQTRAREILDSYRERIESNLTAEQKLRMKEIREANRKAVRTAATQRPRPAVPEEE
jgi:hypothetical protein